MMHDKAWVVLLQQSVVDILKCDDQDVTLVCI